jgi:demethylmenaquinone methyltransferase/2-methoxy-6-polyprenyl-1,4-benzoquinol methylase
MNPEVLQQQIEYYRARAGEYDEWFYRVGRYDRGEELNRLWFDEAAIVMQELASTGPVGTALELACGTGIWTLELAKIAGHITALDSSPEVIEINRQKLNNSPKVEYRQIDLFEWEPQEQFDMVLFTFWLSHVPPGHVDEFFRKVIRALKPGGRCFLCDSRLEPTSTARDFPIREDEHIIRSRRLNDGQEFKIVKVFYEVEEVNHLMSKVGFEPEIKTTPHYFIYGQAIKP